MTLLLGTMALAQALAWRIRERPTTPTSNHSPCHLVYNNLQQPMVYAPLLLTYRQGPCAMNSIFKKSRNIRINFIRSIPPFIGVVIVRTTHKIVGSGKLQPRECFT